VHIAGLHHEGVAKELRIARHHLAQPVRRDIIDRALQVHAALILKGCLHETVKFPCRERQSHLRPCPFRRASRVELVPTRRDPSQKILSPGIRAPSRKRGERIDDVLVVAEIVIVVVVCAAHESSSPATPRSDRFGIETPTTGALPSAPFSGRSCLGSSYASSPLCGRKVRL
jgi:hypothetical protein